MKKFLDKFGVIIIIGCLVVAGIVLYFHYSPAAAPKDTQDITKAFYMDEENGEESVGPLGQIPPLPGKNGKPTVVGAIKYSCDGGKTSQVLYYFKYTDAAQKELNNLPADQAIADLRRADLTSKGQLIRSPVPGSPWIPPTSNAGADLATLPPCPAGGNATIAYPPK